MKKTEVKLKSEAEVVQDNIHEKVLPGEFGAILELTVTDDKTGKDTEHRVVKSKSFVRQFLELFYVYASPVAYVAPMNVRDTANTLQQMAARMGARAFDVDGDAGVTTYGTIVGTGSTAPTINDYAMETPIAHGVGGGQLQYGAVTFGLPTTDATTSYFTVTRNFSNGSGGSITINEIGIYAYGYDKAGAARYFLILRDVISGGIAVPNGQTLTVNHRWLAAV